MAGNKTCKAVGLASGHSGFQDVRRKEREGHLEVVGGESQGFRRAEDTGTTSPSYLLEN